ACGKFTSASWIEPNSKYAVSSRYSVPVTFVPDGPLGVIVTGIVAVWPGPTVIGWNESRLVAGFALSDSRSPVGELTAESNGLVTTLADVVTDSGGGPVVPNVPYSTGRTSHSPVAIGLSANDSDAGLPGVEIVEARSGSP